MKKKMMDDDKNPLTCCQDSIENPLKNNIISPSNITAKIEGTNN